MVRYYYAVVRVEREGERHGVQEGTGENISSSFERVRRQSNAEAVRNEGDCQTMSLYCCLLVKPGLVGKRIEGGAAGATKTFTRIRPRAVS